MSVCDMCMSSVCMCSVYSVCIALCMYCFVYVLGVSSVCVCVCGVCIIIIKEDF